MSKQDTHFTNVFSVVIGLLVVVAIVLFALARIVGGHRQGQEIYVEKAYTESVAQRLQPLVRVAVAGHDNAALAIKPSASAEQSGSALPMPKNGQQVFQQVCSACHGQGIAGAPKAGSAAAWDPRIKKGLAVLYMHALHGFHGESGTMPAKGGRPDLSDDLVKQAVRYMVGLVKNKKK